MSQTTLPLIVFEDEHLLVINKPAGINTHAPGPYAGEGIYDWLKHREPQWASLAIIHRLDKETSGLLAFAKTPEANRSMTRQFSERLVSKTYTLVTEQPVRESEFVVKSNLVRAGERYFSRPCHAGGAAAETRFRLLRKAGALTYVQAVPLTGRTHQIRVHAADAGIAILGDALYGLETTPVLRLHLHAETLEFKHPVSSQPLRLHVLADFEADPRVALRSALIDPTETNAYRAIHGAADGQPGLYVDRLGDVVLSQSQRELAGAHGVATLPWRLGARGGYHRLLTRHVRKTSTIDAAPRHAFGELVSERFTIRENHLHFELSLSEGYSVGLFLDQRDNRRRLLTNHVGAGFPVCDGGMAGREVLNTFSYTCAFSVCAAKAGARVTSLDLSKKYLEWGKRNFALNDLNPSSHDFIYGDAFDWMRRLAKKGRLFDVIILDPPTFSQSKEHGVFRAENDYAQLVNVALPLLKRQGVLFASTNASGWKPEDFLQTIHHVVVRERGDILQEHYAPQPPDFPVTRSEPAYLKTVWLRIP